MAGGQPPFGLLGPDPAVSLRLAGLTGPAILVVLLTACTAQDAPTTLDPAAGASVGVASVAPAPAAPEAPREGQCYDLTLDQALAATTEDEPISCERGHTARTYLVTEPDRLVEGHLLATDSDRVREQQATECPPALADFLGGGSEAMRLSVLRPVWFTPTLAESDAGASWLRCDVVALDGDGDLLRLEGRLEGVLGTATGRNRWGLCATGAPDDPDSRRVPCAGEHTWRAVEVVDLGGGPYPGEETARGRGQEPCQAAGRARAEDPLDFEWGYEWPTEQQWEAGQRYGRCWVPA